jgi:hypothetical protein
MVIFWKISIYCKTELWLMDEWNHEALTGGVNYCCQYSDDSRVLPGDNTAVGREAEGEGGPTLGRQNQPLSGAGHVSQVGCSFFLFNECYWCILTCHTPTSYLLQFVHWWFWFRILIENISFQTLQTIIFSCIFFQCNKYLYLPLDMHLDGYTFLHDKYFRNQFVWDCLRAE